MQAGTTSKTFCPGVRLGWAVGPAEISARLVAAKQLTDQCAGALGQRLFEESERRGWIDEQLTRSRALYRARASGCWRRSSASARGSTLDDTAGRLLLLADAPEGADSVEVAAGRSSTASGSSREPCSSPTAAAPTPSGSFSLVGDAQIDDGIARLGSLL